MSEYDLYGGTPPHQMDSDTSEAAAHQIKSSALTQRQRVHQYIKEQGDLGATDNEIQIALDMISNTEQPRRRELVLKGQIMDSGHRRKTKAGRMAVVWVAANLPEFTPGPYVPIRKQLEQALARIRLLEDENRKLRTQLGKGQMRLI